MSIIGHKTIILTLILLVFCFSNTRAQKLNFGVYSGVNLSNLQGNLTSNQWETKAGQTTGFTVGYHLNESISVRSEISYLNYYYESKPYYSIPLEYSYFGYIYTPSEMSWDFSFLRFPFQIEYHTPTRLQFGISAGMFYSFLLNDDLTQEERNVADKEGWDIYPPPHDWGYMFTTSLLYPVADRVRVYVEGRLASGREVFIENIQAKNRGYEFLFGVHYIPKRNLKFGQNSLHQALIDSLPRKMYLKPNAGMVLSWNAADEKLGNYDVVVGSTEGIIIGKNLGNVISIQSGFQFIRKGYALKDSSQSRYKYISNSNDPNSVQKTVDTRLRLDYLTIPITFNLSFGEQTAYYVDFGFYTGFLINANIQGTEVEKYASSNGYSVNRITVNDAVDGLFDSRDWGYQLGTGLLIPIKQGVKLDIGVYYVSGFSELLKNPNVYSVTNIQEDQSIRNGNISLQVGLCIPY